MTLLVIESESESLSVVSDSLRPHGLYSLWKSPGQNTGVRILSLLLGIFPTQGSNPGLQHCRRILYQLSDKGSPRILEWVAYPSSRGSSQPRIQIRVFCIQANSLSTKLYSPTCLFLFACFFNCSCCRCHIQRTIANIYVKKLFSSLFF